MNIQDLLPKTEEKHELSKVNKVLLDAAKSLEQLSVSLSKIDALFKTANAQFSVFYENFYAANFPLHLGASIASYAAKRISEQPVSSAQAEEISRLPCIVDKLVSEKKLDPRIVELFFTYSQEDANNLRRSVNEIPEHIEKFGSTMKRLKHFFDKKTPVHVYKGLVATRDIRYNGDWNEMIADLEKKLDADMARQEPEEAAYSLRRSILECKIIRRYEDQERINLAQISRIFDRVCAVLDLESSVELYNDLRAVNLPSNVTIAMGEYFAERVHSLERSEIEELIGLVKVRLDTGVYSAKNVELFFLAASEKPGCRNIPVASMPDYLEKFDSSIKELSGFIENHAEYKACVAERNSNYHRSWSRMKKFLGDQLSLEERKAEGSKELSALKEKVSVINSIMEMESKSCLSAVSNRLYSR